MNALSSGDQNDLALMSSLAPSCLLFPLDSLSVWGTERSWGSVSTSLQTVVRSSAIVSLSELCLSETNKQLYLIYTKNMFCSAKFYAK